MLDAVAAVALEAGTVEVEASVAWVSVGGEGKEAIAEGSGEAFLASGVDRLAEACERDDPRPLELCAVEVEPRSRSWGGEEQAASRGAQRGVKDTRQAVGRTQQ